MLFLNRILKLVFVILIIITVVQVGTYIYYQKNSIYNPSLTTNTQRSVTIVPNTKTNVNNNLKQALNDKALRSLYYLKKGTLQQSTANVILQGKITEINTKGGTIENYGKFTLGINIIGDSNDTQDFVYYDTDMAKIKFYRMDGSKNIPIKVNELKINDIIRINETYDMTKDTTEYLIESTITKI